MVEKDTHDNLKPWLDSLGREPEILQIEETGQEVIIIGVEQIDGLGGGKANQFIDQNWADVVCLDLDITRARILTDQAQWDSLTINTVIKEKLLTALMLNLMVAAYQRKYDKEDRSMPGDEIYAAMERAKERSLPVILADRDLHVTYSRASRSVNYVAKFRMLLMALKRLIRYQKIANESVEKSLDDDPMSAFIKELAALEPNLKKPLIDERDEYTSKKIITATGSKVLAVVGAGRTDGIRRYLVEGADGDPADLETVPETSPISKAIKIVVPITLIIGLFYLGWSQGREFVRENLAFWIAANSLLTGLGAIMAGAHILAVLTAVIVAPFSPLIPAGPGTVAAIVQFIVRPPLVADFQNFAEDITHPLRWRKNRILKIVLIMILCGLGNILGTLLGTSRILFSLFS